ncbi:MAG TPA: GAF domain-containing protein, partial [Candidatus Acidoferrales bacterium]|nr:GAF domain-containing protein [Candidatus Acidoferrales bacterium]
MAISDPEIHSVIFDLTKSIAGHSDLETLCQALAAALRRVVNFDDLGVALYDSGRSEFRLHALSTNRPRPQEIPIPADGNPLAEWVWREQKPLVLPSLEDETRGGEVIRIAREGGVRALIVVPLSNGDRRLGFLGFGFVQPYQPDEHVLEFLQRVASEFAVAVDGYLARNALQKERDRIHALFEITTALVSKLPMDELLHEISSQLSKVV